MDRRDFDTLLPWIRLTIVAPPIGTEQPAGKEWRVGFLSSLAVPATAVYDSLHAVALVEGGNVTIERIAIGEFHRMPELAAKLIRLKHPRSSSFRTQV